MKCTSFFLEVVTITIQARSRTDIESELQDAIYQLKAIAENPYNSDYWRVLWNALQNMTEAREFT